MLNRASIFVLTAVVMLGMAFQAGHFVEHATQFGMWLIGNRSRPWMSGPGSWLVSDLASFFGYMAPGICGNAANPASYQNVVGLELLHLVGNLIFLVTLGAMCTLYRRQWMFWAFYVETFHLVEHVMLTTTAIAYGTPIGMSTLSATRPSCSRARTWWATGWGGTSRLTSSRRRSSRSASCARVCPASRMQPPQATCTSANQALMKATDCPRCYQQRGLF